MATNSKRARKKDAEQSNLVAALKFVSAAQGDSKAETQHTHVMLAKQWAVATNPIFVMGHPITDDIDACPHLAGLIDALSKCGQTLSITTLDSGKLSIKSDRFRALVPCVPGALMPPALPDSPCATLNDALRAGFAAVADIAGPAQGREWANAVLLQSGSVVACDGVCAVEYWHGIDLPDLIIPKVAVTAIIKTGKILSKFGFSNSSATFYFDDESWLKTQLVTVQYPNYLNLFKGTSNPWPLPPGFFEALKAVASFSETGQVFFNEHNILASHPNGEEGAMYELEGIPPNKAYNSKYLLAFEKLADRFDFAPHDPLGNCFFFGENLRGVIAAIRR
jgi:hypothetical protein